MIVEFIYQAWPKPAMKLEREEDDYLERRLSACLSRDRVIS